MVVWIEILSRRRDIIIQTVTTCVVVWIEMIMMYDSANEKASPPAWWCGLK